MSGGTTLHIIGAGGHAVVVADCALRAGYDAVHLYADREPEIALPKGWNFILVDDPIALIVASGGPAHVAIGNNSIRQRLLLDAMQAGVNCPPLVHPDASVSEIAELGDGTVVLAGGIANARATLGQGCIVNSGAVVEHDCRLGDAVHLSPRAALAGAVTVGARSWIGIGAVVREGMAIGEDVVVGAGAAVVNNLASDTTVVGVPAKPITTRG